MIDERLLLREEIASIWTIDRGEVIEQVYYFEQGKLVLKPEYHVVTGWEGDDERYSPILLDCFDRGGWFYGLFDGAAIIAVVVLDCEFIGTSADQLQLKFLYVSGPFRGRGLGRSLFERARKEARRRRARRLYISATPSENTVNFYLELGCSVVEEVAPELFALEPRDIHLECDVSS